MKLFLDTAHVESIKKAYATGLLNGVTTNPSHLSNEGTQISRIIKEIAQLLPHGDISVEVTEKSPDAVYQQAHRIAQISPNITVKIPCDSAYLPVINQLVQEGISINVTLIFTAVQGLMCAKLGVTYISPFIGRLDDIDGEGIQLVNDVKRMLLNYEYKTQVLAASIRSIKHLHAVAIAGADVATIPVALFERMIDHPLTQKGMAQFEEDWQKLDLKQFP